MLRQVARFAGFAAGIALLSLSASAPQAGREGIVDLELVLAVDTSSSVSEHEFALQILGLAQAFQDPSVIAAIENSAPNGIAVSVIQWSGAGWQEQTVPFSFVDDAASSYLLAGKIAASKRAIIGGPTALGVLGGSDAEATGLNDAEMVVGWSDDGSACDIELVLEQDGGTKVFKGRYRALTRAGLTRALEASGFAGVDWLMPEDSGYYQPIVVAPTA